MDSNTDTDSQKLNFHISPEIVPPHTQEATLTGIIFKLDAPDTLSPLEFATIQVEGTNLMDEDSNSINNQVAGDWFGGWVIDFDLTKVPDSLREDGHLNPETVKNVELILLYERQIR